MKLAEQMYKIAKEVNKPKISEWILQEIEKETREGNYYLFVYISELPSKDIEGLKAEGFTISIHYSSWGVEDKWKISWNLKDSEVK